MAPTFNDGPQGSASPESSPAASPNSGPGGYDNAGYRHAVAGGRLAVPGSNRYPATHGSRTMTLDPTETYEEGSSEGDGQGNERVVGILELSGESSSGRRVQWDDDVIDNEHLGKKSSKICCIFKKQRAFGESSDESSSESDSDSGSESDGGPSSSRPPSSGRGHGNNHNHNHDHDGECDHHHRHGGSRSKPRKPVLNEYEKMPKYKTSTPQPVNNPPAKE